MKKIRKNENKTGKFGDGSNRPAWWLKNWGKTKRCEMAHVIYQFLVIMPVAMLTRNTGGWIIGPQPFVLVAIAKNARKR